MAELPNIEKLEREIVRKKRKNKRVSLLQRVLLALLTLAVIGALVYGAIKVPALRWVLLGVFALTALLLVVKKFSDAN